MNILADPDAVADGEPRQSRSDSTLWHHAAFCGLSLPLGRSEKSSWQRQTPLASVTIGNSAAGEGADAAGSLPSGRYLRLLLIHFFTIAVETKNPVIPLGESPAELAAAMMLELDEAALAEFAEQCGSLAASRIVVSLEGGAALSVFDARGRPRGTSPDWRPMLRLSSRFLEQLCAQAVQLDRRIVVALGDNLPALDAYAWIASALPRPGEAGAMVGWAELFARFGDPSSTVEAHRASFEQSLQRVSAAWPGVRLIIGEDGVAVRHSERESQLARAAEAASPARPEPAPTETSPHETSPHETSPHETSPRGTSPAETSPAGAMWEIDASATSPEPVVAPGSHDQVKPPARVPEPDAAPRRFREDRIALRSHLTGLHQVLWLHRDGSGDEVVVEVTPGGRYDPQNLTVLALEPIIVQISGGLYTRDFERVSAWVNANRDLIDDVWYNDVASEDEVLGRVKKVPPPGWR